MPNPPEPPFDQQWLERWDHREGSIACTALRCNDARLDVRRPPSIPRPVDMDDVGVMIDAPNCSAVSSPQRGLAKNAVAQVA